jgi:hypothetical protein
MLDGNLQPERILMIAGRGRRETEQSYLDLLARLDQHFGGPTAADVRIGP